MANEITTIIVEEGENNGDSGEHSEPTGGEQSESESDLQTSDIERESGGDENTEIAVARISAERDVAVAAIAAETEQRRIEASASTAQSTIEEESKWREEVNELRDQVMKMEERLLSILQPPLEEVTEEIPTTETEPAIAPEQSSIPSDISESTDEIETALSDASESAEKTVAKVRRYIPI